MLVSIYKFTPFELVYGRKTRTPECTMTGRGRVDPVYNIDNYANEAKFRLQMTAQLTKKLLIKN